MSYETIITNTKYTGHKASTSIPFKDVEVTEFGKTTKARKVLNISTSKGDGSIDTIASVSTDVDRVDGHTGKTYTIQTHALYGDYRKRIASVIVKRVTSKAVLEAHNIALADIERILDQVKTQYA